MSRTKDPLTIYRMKLFTPGNRRYAITINPGLNRNGNRASNISIWGNVTEDLKFKPNLRFVLLSMTEKKKYLFPPEWNIQEAYKVAADDSGEKDAHQGNDEYLIYGDTLLLDETVNSCGLKEDLNNVFGETQSAKILTISYFWLLCEKNLNRLEAEAKVQSFPCSGGMNPAAITRLSQSITKEQIDRFMELRKQRYEQNGKWFGIDSTSLTSYSSSLSDSRWGKNKEHDLQRQQNLMVMYDMNSELPAHYRNLPGNIPDSRTLRLLMEELRSVNFKNFGLILDRAYLTKENLDLLVPNGIKCIFMAKTSDKYIKAEILKASSSDENIRKTGQFLVDYDCYAKECEYPYSYKSHDQKGRGTEITQRLCLFFDPELQGAEDKVLTKEVLDCIVSLDSYIKNRISVEESILKKLRKYIDIKVDEDNIITSYSVNQEKIDERRSRCGYFAIVCCNMSKEEYDISWVMSAYTKRDLQEKAFTYLKSWQNGRRLRTSTELSTEGRKFFQFVTLIINCQLHHLYSGTNDEFKKHIVTPWQALDEMRSVRLVKLKNRKPKVSEFVGKQVDIFEAFGFEIPKGCTPSSKRRSKSGGKNLH